MLKKTLPWLIDTPPAVRSYYYLPIVEKIAQAIQTSVLNGSNVTFLQQFIVDIEEIALSSFGMELHCTENNIAINLRFCLSCHKPLFDKKQKTLPKLSLANGWAIGGVPPELSKLTQAEIRMITKAPVSGVIHLIGREGRGRGVLRTHMMAWNAVPKPAAMQVSQSCQFNFSILKF
jgi:hypothetical protein